MRHGTRAGRVRPGVVAIAQLALPGLAVPPLAAQAPWERKPRDRNSRGRGRPGWRVMSLGVVGIFFISCRSGTDPETAAIPLAPLASTPAPLSVFTDLALATETTGCVIDSYESRVHCIHRSGEAVDVFGGRGQGPGEFRYSPINVVRGTDGTVGVISGNRMTVFDPSGRMVNTVSLPGRVSPVAPFDSIFRGYWRESSRSTGRSEYWHLAVNVRTGEILEKRAFPESLAAEADCPPPPRLSSSRIEAPTSLARGLRFPSGGMVFTALCRGQLLFLENPNAESGILVEAPLYAPEYPSQREVERFRKFCDSPRGRFLGLACDPERFRNTPEVYGTQYWIDDQSRLWVLTNRDREEFSYLDIYAGPEFEGSVRVRHRAVGFNVLGSTLAVLVDRPVGQDDPDGVPDRGIDWYDINGLDFRKGSVNPEP